ncbi:TPA: hypothetical protein ACP099_001756, partial [Streptococcus pyogenes]
LKKGVFMKKTLLLSAAALMVASTTALTTHSVNAQSYSSRTYLKQDGTQNIRQAREAAQLKIRNLLKTYDVTDDNEYKSYYTYYLRQARAGRDVNAINHVIDELEKVLKER